MRDQRVFKFFSSAALYLSLGVVLFSLTQCGKRPPPLPPPTAAPPSTTSSPAEADSRRDAILEPELDYRIEPESIHPGESALLTWTSRNADSVSIEPAIGPVDLSGRIKFFPEQTTTYTISASGPGGSIQREVTVRVSAPGQGPTGIREDDLLNMPLAQQFKSAVKPVFFGFDSAELSAEAKATLDTNISWLSEAGHAEIRFVLEGHADERGSEEYNLSLGDRRAAIVEEYLQAHGISASRMSSFSLGEERPFDTGTTEQAYALNRRTEFVLLQEAP